MLSRMTGEHLSLASYTAVSFERANFWVPSVFGTYRIRGGGGECLNVCNKPAGTTGSAKKEMTHCKHPACSN